VELFAIVGEQRVRSKCLTWFWPGSGVGLWRSMPGMDRGWCDCVVWSQYS